MLALQAEREGIEIRLTDEEIARNQFSKIDLDLFSYLWERLNDERDRISQFNVLESIKKSYWTDRDDGRKMRLMFERASEKVRVFVIDEEAAGDGGLKGFKAYSNYSTLPSLSSFTPLLSLIYYLLQNQKLKLNMLRSLV